LRGWCALFRPGTDSDVLNAPDMEPEYRLLLDNLPQKVFRKDINSVYISANKTYAEEIKLPPEEIRGKTDFDLFPKELAEKYRADDRLTMESGERREFLETYMQDGEPRTVQTLKIPTHDRNGGLTGLMGISWDITERKKMEAALKASEQQKRAVFDQTFEFIGLMTPDGLLIEANRAALEFAGISEKDVIHKPFLETPWWTHSTEQQEKLRRAIEAVNRGEFVRFEATHTDKDNRLHYIDFSLKPVKDPSGKVIFMIPEGRDITEHKLTELSLRERDKQYHALIETTATGFLVIDQKGAVIDANAEYVRLTGHRDLKEIKGRCVLEWTAESGKIKNTDALALFFREGKIRNLEIEYRAPDGTITPVEINATIIEMDGVRYGLSLCRDITERRRREKAIRELTVEKQAAEAASRAKSSFLSTMSHELRTPLNIIITSSGVLHAGMLGELAPKQKEYLGNVLSSGRHLLGLITDMLDLNEIENEKMEMTFTLLDAKTAIKEIVGAFRQSGLYEGVTINESLELEPGTQVLADAQRLRQIMANLLANAIKFTEATGSVAVEAGIADGRQLKAAGGAPQNLPDTDKYLLVCVRDTGIGIKPQDMAKLFKPFSQVDSSDNRKYEGTGLGLVLAKKLVELHKGAIWAESVYGKGSAFFFVLPLEKYSA